MNQDEKADALNKEMEEYNGCKRFVYELYEKEDFCPSDERVEEIIDILIGPGIGLSLPDFEEENDNV
jgi:hypothetical protein